jgi:hypothetical protein
VHAELPDAADVQYAKRAMQTKSRDFEAWQSAAAAKFICNFMSLATHLCVRHRI